MLIPVSSVNSNNNFSMCLSVHEEGSTENVIGMYITSISELVEGLSPSKSFSFRNDSGKGDIVAKVNFGVKYQMNNRDEAAGNSSSFKNSTNPLTKSLHIVPRRH
jgi:hypothetical protein